MTGCPSREQLRQLLAQQLDAAEGAALEAHVEGCAACQDSLARLSDEEDTSAPPPVTDVPESTADFVRRLGEQPPPATDLDSLVGENDEPASVTFPDPPTEKGPLGRLGCLHMRRELGRGRFGVVYEALDELDRLVAVKVLKPQLAADPSERSRFEREARKAAAVRHDHIVTVYRVGQTEGKTLPYLVMEYQPGETLAARLRRQGVLPPREAAELVRQAALGLAAAHARGLVHRDVKPSNILLAAVDGRAKITDFGLARATAAGAAASQSGAVVGTPAYMSPEQITAPGKVDGRSDVYSLGVVLYEALTGERPFRGVAHLVLGQVVHDEPRPPRKLNDAVPRDLETIALKAMAKEPEGRYATAGALAGDLRRYLSGEPITARPAGVVEKGWKWARRRPAAAGLLGLVGLVVVGLAGGGWWYSQQEYERAEREASLRRTADTAAQQAKDRTVELAQQIDYTKQILDLLETQDPRGWEWYFLTLKSHAFKPGTVQVWDATTGEELHGHVRDAVGPDGRRLASARACSASRMVAIYKAGSQGFAEVRRYLFPISRIWSVFSTMISGLSRYTALAADPENRDDVRMVQMGGSLGLVLEALQLLRVHGSGEGQHLEGHTPAQGDLHCLIDHAHAAAANLLDNLIVAERPRGLDAMGRRRRTADTKLA
jgi:hypothetical protein